MKLLGEVTKELLGLRELVSWRTPLARSVPSSPNAVLPRVADHGLQVTYDLRHWVHPPWRVLLRSRPPTHWLDVHMGRLVLRGRVGRWRRADHPIRALATGSISSSRPWP